MNKETQDELKVVADWLEDRSQMDLAEVCRILGSQQIDDTEAPSVALRKAIEIPTPGEPYTEPTNEFCENFWSIDIERLAESWGEIEIGFELAITHLRLALEFRATFDVDRSSFLSGE